MALVELVEAKKAIRSGARLSQPFFVMNGLATVVASYGLLANSTAVVIGAMLVAMLLGPITGMALALADGESELFADSLAAEVAGALWVLAVAFVIGWIHRDIPAGSELLNRTQPNLLDIMIALAGGAAGAYSMAKPKFGSGLVGAAIATALVPPLCTCSIFLARGEPDKAVGGLLLWFANLIAIQVASALVLFLLGCRGILKRREEAGSHFARITLSLIILAALFAGLGAALAQAISFQRLEQGVFQALKGGMASKKGAYLVEVDLQPSQEREGWTAFAITRTPTAFTPEETQRLQELLPPNVSLHVRSIKTTDTTPEGYVFGPSEAATVPPPSEGDSGGGSSSW